MTSSVTFPSENKKVGYQPFSKEIELQAKTDFFFFFFFNVYLLLRERECVCVNRGVAEREGERIRSRIQALNCQHRAQCPA